MSGKKLSPRQLGNGRLPSKSVMGKEARKRRQREDVTEETMPKPKR